MNFLFFCFLLHRLAVKISLPFHIFLQVDLYWSRSTTGRSDTTHWFFAVDLLTFFIISPKCHAARFHPDSKARSTSLKSFKRNVLPSSFHCHITHCLMVRKTKFLFTLYTPICVGENWGVDKIMLSDLNCMASANSMVTSQDFMNRLT